MAKSLLKQVMEKPATPKRKESFVDIEGLIAKINSGYTINRVPKETKKALLHHQQLHTLTENVLGTGI